MPKGVEKDALGSYGTATGQANNAYGVAAPIYQQMAQRPQGYTPQQMANQVTASNQTLGGANSSAVGEGALASARTNNAGGYQAAIDDAARQSGAQQSQNVLGIQNRSDMLARQQQEQGLEGLSGVYREGNQAGQGYLNEANQAAANNPWMKLLQAGVGASGQAAAAYLGKPPAAGG
jgi:hypothetical protein